MAVSLPSQRATTSTSTTSSTSTSARPSDAHEEITAPIRKARGRDEREIDSDTPVAPAPSSQRLEPVPEPAPSTSSQTTTAPLPSTAKHEAVLERVQELLNDPASNVYFDGRHAVLNLDGLTVRLSTDSNGQTQVSMHTSDPVRAEQLTSTSSELAHSLNHQGLQLSTMNVQTTPAPSSAPLPLPTSSSPSFSGGQQQQQQSQHQGTRDEPAFAPARPAPPRASTSTAPPSRGIRA